jgi:hypothetical protein
MPHAYSCLNNQPSISNSNHQPAAQPHHLMLQIHPPARHDTPVALPSPQVVGKVSPWINPDSANPVLAQDSAAALRQELAWAAHLGLQAVILPTPPERMSAVNYAQVLSQVLAGLSNMALWVRLPLVSDTDSCYHARHWYSAAIMLLAMSAWPMGMCLVNVQYKTAIPV